VAAPSSVAAPPALSEERPAFVEPPAPHVAAPAPVTAEAEVHPSLGPAAGPEVGDFDLAAELSGAIGGDEPSLRTLAGTEEEGFEQVFDAFKSGIERELGDGDHEARYDLGIAYREMGLLEDAIAAFQIAMHAPARHLACLHMLGLCALELGRAADAVAHLEQALSQPELPADQRLPLRYDAGRAYAALGDAARARAAFEEVRAADPSFGEVERELAALEAPATEAERGDAEASGEAYESFDDLLSGGPRVVQPPRYESFDDLFTDEPNDGPHETPLELAEPRTAEPEPDVRAHPEPAPEPAPESDAIEIAAEESAPSAAPPTSAAPRRRRKISFV
jgi:hypothetical protein